MIDEIVDHSKKDKSKCMMLTETELEMSFKVRSRRVGVPKCRSLAAGVDCSVVASAHFLTRPLSCPAVLGVHG